MPYSKTVSALAIGDMITDGQADRTKTIRVKSLTRCPSTRKGMPFFHVNDFYCYWGQASVLVQTPKEKSA
jgi:hypothetical protein